MLRLILGLGLLIGLLDLDFELRGGAAPMPASDGDPVQTMDGGSGSPPWPPKG